MTNKYTVNTKGSGISYDLQKKFTSVNKTVLSLLNGGTNMSQTLY